MRDTRASGFTLIEVAIVLVIIGLLLAGVFKGQELLVNARVRSLIQQHEGVRTAYFGFLDRYRAPPGDFANAAASITGVSATCGAVGNPGGGDGNSRIDQANGEYILAWEHLSKAGFLTGSYNCTGNNVVTAESVPRNPYGQFLQLIYDGAYAGNARPQHNLKTGNNMPSDVLAEIDRKIDDGNALQGTFRGSTYTTSAPTDGACWDAGGMWSAQPVLSNCGGATLY
jgi:prepilin-type N-terminal cleavage/methylation domain-containing protein